LLTGTIERGHHLYSPGQEEYEQFFTDEAALGPITQMIENRLIRFDERSFNDVNLQRPDWICGPFCATFKLARLVEITDGDKGGDNFFAFSNRP